MLKIDGLNFNGIKNNINFTSKEVKTAQKEPVLFVDKSFKMPQTCLEYYSSSFLGKRKTPKYLFENINVLNSDSKSGNVFSEISKKHRANRIAKMSSNLSMSDSIYLTVKAFRDKIADIATIRDNSIEDFNYFKNNFLKFKDYLNNANPAYLTNLKTGFNPNEFDDFFGNKSKIYFEQAKKQINGTNEIYSVNIPCAVILDEHLNNNRFHAAKEVYDLKNDIMFGEVEQILAGDTLATQINAFSPKAIKLPFMKFINVLNSPCVINQAVIQTNGNFSAESMTLFEQGKNGKILSSTTYLRPEVTYLKNDSKDVKFNLNADYSFTTVFDKHSAEKRKFLINPNLTYDEDNSFCVEAKDALVEEKAGSGFSNYYSNYLEDPGLEGKILYDAKKTLDLSKIK